MDSPTKTIKKAPKKQLGSSSRDAPNVPKPIESEPIPTVSKTQPPSIVKTFDSLDSIFDEECVTPLTPAEDVLPTPDTMPVDNTPTSTEVQPQVVSSPPTDGLPITPKKKIMTFSKRRPFVEPDSIATNTSVEFVAEVQDIKWKTIDKPCGPSPKKKPKTQAQAPDTPKKEQSFLDFGQKNFGALTVCSVCSMRYQAGTEDDEDLHKTFHRRFIESSSDNIDFNGWKDEDVVKRCPDGSRIIRLSTTDQKVQTARIQQLSQVLKREVGGPIECDDPTQQLYLYVSANKKIMGCVMARTIESARRKSAEGVESTETAECCVTRLWVHKSRRRQGIATVLVDAARCSLIYGQQILKEMVAYLQTSKDGEKFVVRYGGRKDFLHL